jgi:predicted RNase H-like HicB family nuclease
MKRKSFVKESRVTYQTRKSQLNKTIKAYIYRGDKYYIGECVDISVVTQGKTVDETIANLQEAVRLHLEGENLAELGFCSEPSLLIIMEEPVSVA